MKKSVATVGNVSLYCINVAVLPAYCQQTDKTQKHLTTPRGKQTNIEIDSQ